jgi:hypothetical protein
MMRKNSRRASQQFGREDEWTGCTSTKLRSRLDGECEKGHWRIGRLLICLSDAQQDVEDVQQVRGRVEIAFGRGAGT